ncbi:MAG: hypothetical protein AAF698_03900 [Pseudomonadota bacterium]
MRVAAMALSAALSASPAGAQPAIPEVSSERWSLWYYDEDGFQTLEEDGATWTQGVVREREAKADLTIDCAGQDAGVGYNVTLQRPRRPQGPFEGADLALSFGVIVVAGTGYAAQSLYEKMVEPVAFQGYGAAEEGGYTFGAEPALVDALRRGASVTFVTVEAGNMTFSLTGSSKIIDSLGCG